jgi:hypothetical protein
MRVGIQKLIRFLLASTIHVPIASFSAIKSDLEFSIDCCHSAAAATHPLSDFSKRHIAIAKQHENSIHFILGKVLTLRSDHVASSAPLSGTKERDLSSSTIFDW